jgi:peptide/nickel transport system substrate-binding protein
MRAFFPIVFAMCLWIAGCSQPHLADDVAVLHVEMPFRNLDPRAATDAVSQRINNLTHIALVRQNEKMQLVGELAESWKIEGYRRFKFKLRPNVVFQDGSAVTADAVLTVFKEYQTDSPHSFALEHVIHIKKLGPLEVLIETDRAQPFLLSDLPLLKVFKRDGGRIVGAGRYLTVLQASDEVRLQRFDRYFEKAPANGLKQITFRYVSDETTRYQLFKRGESNSIYNSLSLSKLEHLIQNLPEGQQYLVGPGLSVTYLSFNFRNEKLKDLRVRQAIAHAIDREAIMRFRMGPFATIASGLISPSINDYYEPRVRRYEFNQAKAEKLLDEAGFPRRGRWRFKLSFKCTSEKFSYDIVMMLVGQLQAVGIDARIQTVEAGTFFSDIRAGNFDVFVSRWTGVSNPSIYYKAFHTSQIGKTNRGAYSNAKLDELLEQATSEINDVTRQNCFRKFNKLQQKNYPT